MSSKVDSRNQNRLVLRGISKSYSGVRVVKNVSLELLPGKVVGLVGENGAGKSTTSSIIAGMVQPDSGQMMLKGQNYTPRNPSEALKLGVALIHQEIRMVKDLSVAENIFLGRLPKKNGVVDRDYINSVSRDVLKALGSSTDPRRLVNGLSIAAQQEIEIAKALAREPEFIIFDEPSSSLGETEANRVFDQIDLLRSRGVGVLYISHRLDEINRLSDAIICMRDGEVVEKWDIGNVPKETIVKSMVGRDFTYGHSAPPEHSGESILEVRGLGRRPVLRDVNFELSKGEILGVAGLVGAGRTEMVRTIAGADAATEGEVILEGEVISCKHPESTITAGIAMVPEDRKNQGLILSLTAQQNIVLPWEKVIGKRGLITRKWMEKTAKEQADFLDIRGRTDIEVKYLSGGNQQKVLLGKWLVKQPKVLILDEPTRGVDVGAKMKIYETVRALAAKGVAIIVVSSELEEVLGLSHRILVMGSGVQKGILSREEATPTKVMALAVEEREKIK